MELLRWWWRHRRAQHRLWAADLAYRRQPTPTNERAVGLAALYARQIDARRP
jgi:hypothetical protein